jgi:hypothetical protein
MPMKTRAPWLGVLLTAGMSASAWAQTSENTLKYKGQLSSKDVRVVDGQPYVPLSDVAKMLGGSVVKTPGGGYELRAGGAHGATADASGGANQVNGRAARIGQTVFDGFWRVTLLAPPQLADTYQSQYMANSKTYVPDGPNQTLAIFSCRLKNGMKHPEAWCQYDETALTDDQGHSYPPKSFDMRYNGPMSTDILPGAALDAVLVFSVPKGTNLKDLVITTGNYLPHGKPSNIRISLTP